MNEKDNQLCEQVISEVKSKAPAYFNVFVSEKKDHIVLRDLDSEVHVCLWILQNMKIKQLEPRLHNPTIGHKWTVEQFIAHAVGLLKE